MPTNILADIAFLIIMVEFTLLLLDTALSDDSRE